VTAVYTEPALRVGSLAWVPGPLNFKNRAPRLQIVLHVLHACKIAKTIVCAYAHTAKAPPSVTSSFFEELQDCLRFIFPYIAIPVI